MWTYTQSEGRLFEPTGGDCLAVAYSGYGEGKNDPALQAVKDIGPIPRGRWHIGPAYTHPHLGPLTMDLTPADGTNTFGRSEFRIHGDAPEHLGAASHGCIVASHDAREAINDSADKMLEVIA